jgi:hypothetical protein
MILSILSFIIHESTRQQKARPPFDGRASVSIDFWGVSGRLRTIVFGELDFLAGLVDLEGMQPPA